MRQMSDYIRSDGVVVMKTGDAGDGAMKTAMFNVGNWRPTLVCNSQLDSAIVALFPKPGVLIRGPHDGTAWHANPACTSGDQTVGWFCLFALYRVEPNLVSLAWAHAKRFGFCQNWQTETGGFQIADFLRPDCWGMVIRGLRFWFLWPLLLIFDMSTLVNSLLLVMNKNPDDVGNDQNQFVIMYTQMKLWPTPVSWLARKLYVWLRFSNYGCFMSTPDSDDDADAIQDYSKWKGKAWPMRGSVGALWWYHRDSQGAPPMWILWTDIVKGF